METKNLSKILTSEDLYRLCFKKTNLFDEDHTYFRNGIQNILLDERNNVVYEVTNPASKPVQLRIPFGESVEEYVKSNYNKEVF